MANPQDPNMAARGLRMPGVGGITDAISNAAGTIRDGAAGLYNRVMGGSPVTPAAAPAAPAAAPLPAIDPAMADRANATMRASAAPQPPIPTLTDVVKPGLSGPFQPPGEIPTLTDVVQSGKVTPPAFTPAAGGANPNVPPGGMSAERAAFNAEQGLRMGPPPPPPTIGRTLASAAGDAGRFLKDGVPQTKMEALGAVGAGLGAAASFAPHWDAFKDDSGLDAGQKLKLFTRDTTRAIGGALGGLAGAGVGSAFAPVAGTVAGGALGGVAGYEGVDALGGGLRRGANWINEKLGGSPNYITSTDEDLAAAAAKKGVAAPAAAVAQPVAAAPAAPVVPADVAEFNAAMKKQGANAQMTVGADGLRTIGNPVQADAKAIEANDARLAQLTADRAAGMRANDQWALGQMSAAADRARVNPMMDPYRMNDDIEAANRSGNGARIQAAYQARDNALRTQATEHESQRSAGLTMRGQDLQAQGQRATNQLGMFNAMREQANFNTREGREAAAQNFTQGESAEKHLDDALTSRFTTGTDKDGKPQVNVAAKNAALAGIQRSAAALGVNSVAELSKPDRERLIAGADLAAKVNADASNILPWKPDVLGEIMPHDLIGLTKNESGDYVVPRGAAAGRVIPARFLSKVNADRFGGQPTDIYDSLKAK